MLITITGIGYPVHPTMQPRVFPKSKAGKDLATPWDSLDSYLGSREHHNVNCNPRSISKAVEVDQGSSLCPGSPQLTQTHLPEEDRRAAPLPSVQPGVHVERSLPKTPSSCSMPWARCGQQDHQLMGPGLPWLLHPIQGLKLLSPTLIMYHHTDQQSDSGKRANGESFPWHGNSCPCLQDNEHLDVSHTSAMITDTLLKPFLQVWTLMSNLTESIFPPIENSNPVLRAQSWGS